MATLLEEATKLKDDLKLAVDRAEKAEANLTKANTRISELETAATTSAGRITALETENANLTKANHELTTKLAATEKDVDRRAGLKSAEQLAKVGVKPVAEAEQAGSNATDLWAQYRAIEDPKAKREFYLKHKEQM